MGMTLATLSLLGNNPETSEQFMICNKGKMISGRMCLMIVIEISSLPGEEFFNFFL